MSLRFSTKKEKASDKKALMEQIERDYQKVHDGLNVLKVGRRGTYRRIKLFLSKDHRLLEWSSQLFGLKFGRVNRVEIHRLYRFGIGRTTPNFKMMRQDAPQYPSLSVFYASATGDMSLDVMVSKQEDFDSLVDVITALLAKVKQEKENLTPDELFLLEMWHRADANGDGDLSEREVSDLLASMNININRKAVQKIMKTFDVDGNNTLDFGEFRYLLNKLRERLELRAMWPQLLEGKFNIDGAVNLNVDVPDEILKKTISLSALKEFWLAHQKETLTNADALSRIRKQMRGFTIHPHDIKISYMLWMSMICSSDNDIFIPQKAKEYQDMTHPLSHYFIASSHNTYLAGDQLTSHSSVQRYIDDLLSGCRCVELDCWDGDDGQPIITHGYTLTSTILYKDVILAIRDNGFQNSPYPIILSIENHCGLEQQLTLIETLKEVLQDKLYLAPEEVGETEMFPSPEALKYKVLLKGKKIDKDFIYMNAVKATSSDASSPMTSTRDVLPSGRGDNRSGSDAPPSVLDKINESHNHADSAASLSDVSQAPATSTRVVTGEEQKASDESQPPRPPSEVHGTPSAKSSGLTVNRSTREDSASPRVDPESAPSPSARMAMLKASNSSSTHVGSKSTDNSEVAVHPQLSAVTALGGTKIKGFGSKETSFSVPYGLCTSFEESKVAKFSKSDDTYQKWVAYNQKHFSRIYPAGTRVDSSNYDPGEAWAAGAQLVALNYQTKDLNMHYNYGRFRENGNCGYVLKPEYLISQTPKPPSPAMKLTINVLSAHQLPKPRGATEGEIIDPYVIVNVTGEAADRAKWHTKTVIDNGLNPVWNEVHTFTITNPDIALVSFEVMDEDVVNSEFIAFASMPVSCMRPGLRTCMLMDEAGRRDGDFMFPSLLMHIRFEDYEYTPPLVTETEEIASSK